MAKQLTDVLFVGTRVDPPSETQYVGQNIVEKRSAKPAQTYQSVYAHAITKQLVQHLHQTLEHTAY